MAWGVGSRLQGRLYLDRGLELPDGAPAAGDGVHRPEFSVVMSTFNRSNVLRYAVASVIAQSVDDWELLVVGDACTDDTAAVVAGFQDRRVRFVSLARNHGEQSAPNSIGARLAQGRFIAWLNHDDLWFPDHLATMRATIAATGADVVASEWFTVGPHADVDLAAGRLRAGLYAPRATRQYDYLGFFPASSWLVAAETVRRVGDWGSGFLTRGVPSQDYLYRCWATGSRIAISPRPTMVAIQSGLFDRAYSTRRAGEHESFAPLVVGGSVEAFRRSVEIGPAWPSAGQRTRSALAGRELIGRSYRVLVRELVVRPIVPAAARLGVSPHALLGSMTGRGRGGTIRRLRVQRGLSVDP